MLKSQLLKFCRQRKSLRHNCNKKCKPSYYKAKDNLPEWSLSVAKIFDKLLLKMPYLSKLNNRISWSGWILLQFCTNVSNSPYFLYFDTHHFKETYCDCIQIRNSEFIGAHLETYDCNIIWTKVFLAWCNKMRLFSLDDFYEGKALELI